jgi:hypothetical protein
MVTTSRTPSRAFLGPEYNAFLFAAIGSDRSGGQLSVVSALARLDLDPWDEAARLARMPAEGAARKLSALIAALPELNTPRPDPVRAAARLVALLPNRGRDKQPEDAPAASTAKLPSQMLIYALVFAGLFIVGQQLSAHYHQPNSPAGPAIAQAAQTTTTGPFAGGPK